MGGRRPARRTARSALGLNVVEGKVVYPGVAEAFGLPLVDVAVGAGVTDGRRRDHPAAPRARDCRCPCRRHPGCAPGTTSPARTTATLAPASGSCSAPGFAFAIPRVRVPDPAAVRARAPARHQLPNTPATIDSDYRGELMVALINLGAETFAVTRGMRIAQLVFGRVERVGFRRWPSLPGDGARGEVASAARARVRAWTLVRCIGTRQHLPLVQLSLAMSNALRPAR